MWWKKKLLRTPAYDEHPLFNDFNVFSRQYCTICVFFFYSSLWCVDIILIMYSYYPQINNSKCAWRSCFRSASRYAIVFNFSILYFCFFFYYVSLNWGTFSVFFSRCNRKKNKVMIRLLLKKNVLFVGFLTY